MWAFLGSTILVQKKGKEKKDDLPSATPITSLGTSPPNTSPFRRSSHCSRRSYSLEPSVAYNRSSGPTCPFHLGVTTLHGLLDRAQMDAIVFCTGFQHNALQFSFCLSNPQRCQEVLGHGSYYSYISLPLSFSKMGKRIGNVYDV